jgi:transcriptional regulator with XRE-family HTH domain
MPDSSTPLQEFLKRKIAEGPLSARKMSIEAGLSESGIKNILYGKSGNPRSDTVRKLAKYFKCSENELQYGIEENIGKDLVLYKDAVKKAVEYLENKRDLDLNNLIEFIDKLWRYQQKVGEINPKIIDYLYNESLKKID